MDPVRQLLSDNLLKLRFEDYNGVLFETENHKGDFTHSEIGPGILNEVQNIDVRGNFKGEIYAGRIYITGSWSEVLDKYADEISGSTISYLTRTGFHANAGLVSTRGPNKPFTVHISAVYETRRFGQPDQILQFRDCTVKWNSKAGKPTEASFSFVSTGEPYLNGVRIAREHRNGV